MISFSILRLFGPRPRCSAQVKQCAADDESKKVQVAGKDLAAYNKATRNKDAASEKAQRAEAKAAREESEKKKAKKAERAARKREEKAKKEKEVRCAVVIQAAVRMRIAVGVKEKLAEEKAVKEEEEKRSAEAETWGLIIHKVERMTERYEEMAQILARGATRGNCPALADPGVAVAAAPDS